MASMKSKEVQIEGSNDVLQIKVWDTAGQEKYRSLAAMYYQEAAAAILVYDITKRETFDGITYWISELKARAPEGIKIAIAANKSDLVEQEAVNFSDAKKYADEHRAIFKMTSATDGMGIQDLFLDIAAACGQATSSTPTFAPVEVFYVC